MCAVGAILIPIRGAILSLQFDDLTFDPDARQLRVSGKEVKLSPKAFDLLALLIEFRPRAVSKADIRARLWPETFVSDSSLPSLISEIRDGIGDHDRQPRFVRTLHGFGYAFQAAGSSSAALDSGAAKPAGWLIGADAEIPLFAGDNILGREGAGVILLKSSTVSRRHARIAISATGVVIEDLDSKNGTFVNDGRVAAPAPVADGDQVRIGSLLFTFRSSQHAASTESVSTRSETR